MTQEEKTSEQVLDALVKAIENNDFHIDGMAKCGSVKPADAINDNSGYIEAYTGLNGFQVFPATAQGLIQALTFAGLKIEEGGK